MENFSPFLSFPCVRWAQENRYLFAFQTQNTIIDTLLNTQCIHSPTNESLLFFVRNNSGENETNQMSKLVLLFISCFGVVLIFTKISNRLYNKCNYPPIHSVCVRTVFNRLLNGLQTTAKTYINWNQTRIHQKGLFRVTPNSTTTAIPFANWMSTVRVVKTDLRPVSVSARHVIDTTNSVDTALEPIVRAIIQSLVNCRRI